jgi:hypothetical protein
MGRKRGSLESSPTTGFESGVAQLAGKWEDVATMGEGHGWQV